VAAPPPRDPAYAVARRAQRGAIALDALLIGHDDLAAHRPAEIVFRRDAVRLVANRFIRLLRAAEAEARAAGRGLWGCDRAVGAERALPWLLTIAA
jgi:hypothetical protein